MANRSVHWRLSKAELLAWCWTFCNVLSIQHPYLGGLVLPVGASAVSAVLNMEQGGPEAVVPLLLPAALWLSVWMWEGDF